MKKILIAGGTGLVGTRLLQHLPPDQYHIHILTRSPKSGTEQVTYYQWNLDSQTIQDGATDVDVIINLTGAGVADKRWSAARKRLIIESRTKSAALLLKGIQSSSRRPQLYIGASAVGYYGDRGSELLHEDATPGKGFLSESCIAWEDAHHLLSEAVDRLAIVRIGIVLSMDGGALPKMLMTRSVGIFNYFGDGSQYYSWIHIADLCRLIRYLIDHQQLSGTYNAVGPQPMTNKDLMRDIIDDTALSGLLLPAPAIALRVAMGEMAAVVLDSCRASSQRIEEAGFKYEHRRVGKAVADLL